ncbi:MAG: hypothetical protein HY645_07935 [Acidobacteria bacterium]|nr:hypothetical protein [Acidobacteriota bacterium]
MKTRWHWVWVVVFATVLYESKAQADVLEMKDGSRIEGIVKKVAHGEVELETPEGIRTFNILHVERMELDTPRLEVENSEAMKHFLGSQEAQEMVGHIEEISRAAGEIRQLTLDIKSRWDRRPSGVSF